MKRVSRSGLVSILSLVLAVAAAQASLDISGDVLINRTLGLTSPAADGTYIVIGDLTVRNGATLTVEAGVEIRFQAGTSMVIGIPVEAGTLLCQGTSGQPITLTSDESTPGPGDWNRLDLTATSVGCQLDHTLIEYGGSADGCLHIGAAGVQLTSCEIQESGDRGVCLEGSGSMQATSVLIHDNTDIGLLFYASSSAIMSLCQVYDNGATGILSVSDGSLAMTGGSVSGNSSAGLDAALSQMDLSISGVTFSGNGGAPIVGDTSQMGGITGNTYSGNGTQAVVAYGDVIDQDATWVDQGIPYRISVTHAFVQGQDGPDSLTTLTIEPGATLEFDSVFLRIGDDSDVNLPGALDAQGLMGSPITFTGVGGSPGDWEGIYFARHSDDATCRLDYCVVEHGGASASNSNVTCSGSSPTMTNSIIRLSALYGVAGITSDAAPVMTDCFIRANTEHPISLHASSVGALTTPLNTYGLNGDDRIRVVGGTIALDATWIDPGIPYSIEGELEIQGTDGGDSVSTLSIEPGAELQFASAVGLSVGSSSPASPGALSAVGTSGDRITFTGATATPGHWNGIYFHDHADDALCLLEYCDILYGGNGSYRNVYCEDSSPTLRSCDIHYCQGDNVYATGSAQPILEDCDIAYGISSGIYSNNGANPQVTGGSIRDTSGTGYGVWIYGSSHVTLSGVSLLGNSYGVHCWSGFEGATVTDCSFIGNSSYPIRLPATYVSGLTGCTYTANGIQKIQVLDWTISQDATWEDQGIPYLIADGNLIVQGQDGPDSVTTLTLEPGATLEFDSTYLRIGSDSSSSSPGGLMAEGTEASPITFTATTASPGSWSGLYFAEFSDDSLCVLEHCLIEYGGTGTTYHGVTCSDSSPTLRDTEIRYGGGSGVAAITSGANPSLEDCHIHDNTDHGVLASPGLVQIVGGVIESNGGAGVHVEGSAAGPPITTVADARITGNDGTGIHVEGVTSAPGIVSCIIQSNNGTSSGYGVYVTGGAEPFIGGSASYTNTIEGHDSYGVYNDTTTTCLIAQHNYWGAAGGPHDAGFGADGCMDTGNLNLAADWVSEDVDYSNWVGAAPTVTPTPTVTATPTEILTPTPTPPPPLTPSTSGMGLVLLLLGLGSLISVATRRRSGRSAS